MVLAREIYKEEIIRNLQYCQLNEGLEIYCYVLMTNHLHVIASSANKDLGELLGRFKSYTAKKILKHIQTNLQESRREWLLNLFTHFARKSSQNSQYHFWNYTIHPFELWSKEIIEQKREYIHTNPVRARIVMEPHHYLYSSACPYSPGSVAIINLSEPLVLSSKRRKTQNNNHLAKESFHLLLA